ncbi:MAG TPA: TonB-dependent receptor [Steroidobacteraceae bacterium]|nr:TonB-dependent receptor [Steroidobacteraceae bacterium]
MRRMSGRWSVYCGVGAALCSLCATAAEEAPGTGDVLEEVVVTAEKREERLIDVPIAITAVTTDALATQDLTQLRDYYSRVPGLQYNGDTTYDLSLRGITTGNATSPTISILIDDVQFGASTVGGLGNSHFPDFDPSMLERVEVLRGPQGTLYGASSLGGLLKFVTRQPDTQNFSGRVEAGLETTDGGGMGWTTRGSVNIPLVSDVAGLRVSAFKRIDPAWLDNVSSSAPYESLAKNVNTANTYGYHAALLVKPFDGVSVTLSALQQKRNAQFYSGVQVQPNAAGYPVFSEPMYGNSVTNLALGPTADIGDQQLYSARIEADLPASMHLTSITAWGKSAGTNYQDVSSVFVFMPAFYGPGRTEIADAAQTEKFSQELRLSGKIDQLDWRGGLFYTREASSVDQTLDFTDQGASGVSVVPYVGLSPYTYKERAVFADFTYHIMPKLDLQAGVRWARNEQVSGNSATIDPILINVFGPSQTSPNLYSNDTSTTWEVSPVYHFTQDLMSYFRVATGYRPGGPNMVLPDVPRSFGPDKVTNYELGLKGESSDRTVSYDVALYDIEWKNIQLQDTDAVSQFTYTTNGGKARSRGIEAEAGWKPYRGLNIDASATFTDATLTEDLQPQSGIDSLIGKAGDRLPGSARFTSNLAIQQDFPIVANVTGFVGGNWSYIGARRSTFQLFERDATDASLNDATPRFTLPGYSLIDFQTGVNWDGWRATIFLRNAFNKLGVITADNRNGTSVTTVNFLTPRTVGLTVSKDF